MHKTPEPDPLALLTEGAAALGLELAPATLGHLQIYLEELKLWNAKTNLTGLKTDRDMVIKHFLDSLAVLPFLDAAASLVDLGSGAGFPGLVLKLARPHTYPDPGGGPPEKSRVSGVSGLPLQVDRRRGGPDPSHPPPGPKSGSRRWRRWSPGPPLSCPVCWSWPRRSWRREAWCWPSKACIWRAELETAGSACPLLGLGPLEQHKYHLPISGEPRLLVMARKA